MQMWVLYSTPLYITKVSLFAAFLSNNDNNDNCIHSPTVMPGMSALPSSNCSRRRRVVLSLNSVFIEDSPELSLDFWRGVVVLLFDCVEAVAVGAYNTAFKYLGTKFLGGPRKTVLDHCCNVADFFRSINVIELKNSRIAMATLATALLSKVLKYLDTSLALDFFPVFSLSIGVIKPFGQRALAFFLRV